MKTMSTRARLAAALAALAVIAAGTSAQLALAKEPAPEVPEAIAVEAGHKLFLLAHATGVQIYTCTATATVPTWSFVAPRANLYDDDGKLLTTHFAGPTWQTKDGSFVVGAVVERAPVAGAIPWLLLQVVARGGPDDGRLSSTAYIQRLATTGGLAPAGSCTLGTTVEVPYTADYAFWKRSGS